MLLLLLVVLLLLLLLGALCMCMPAVLCVGFGKAKLDQDLVELISDLWECIQGCQQQPEATEQVAKDEESDPLPHDCARWLNHQASHLSARGQGWCRCC